MKEDSRQITIGDESKISTQQSGNWQEMIKFKTGNPKSVTLDEVCYVPELKYNLILLAKELNHGWIVSRNNQQFFT
jgi:hypothetical protein